MTRECLNSKYTSTEYFNYCPKCGQETKLHRLSIHEVVHYAIHYFTHADAESFIVKFQLGLILNVLNCSIVLSVVHNHDGFYSEYL